MGLGQPYGRPRADLTRMNDHTEGLTATFETDETIPDTAARLWWVVAGTKNRTTVFADR